MLKNICLLGLPYSGKSFLGKRLSNLKKMGFVDIDKMIENKYNMKLSNIANKNGLDFINIENDVAKTIDCDNCVISPGGSIVYSEESINHFKNNLNCEIIHLKLSYQEFINRVDNIENRGIIMKDGYTLEQLYNERTRLCNKYANKVINADDIHDIYNNIKSFF